MIVLQRSLRARLCFANRLNDQPRAEEIALIDYDRHTVTREPW